MYVKVQFRRYRLVNKKQKRARARKISESFTRREKANEIIAFAADNNIETVLQKFNASLEGLSEKEVIASRNAYGENKVTHEKKKTMPQRLAEAFINPFTAILFCLAIVSTITDIILPVVRGTPEDADPLTVIIIMTGGDFRRVALCSGIPLRQCCRKTIRDDHHNLYG